MLSHGGIQRLAEHVSSPLFGDRGGVFQPLLLLFQGATRRVFLLPNISKVFQEMAKAADGRCNLRGRWFWKCVLPFHSEPRFCQKLRALGRPGFLSSLFLLLLSPGSSDYDLDIASTAESALWILPFETPACRFRDSFLLPSRRFRLDGTQVSACRALPVFWTSVFLKLLRDRDVHCKTGTRQFLRDLLAHKSDGQPVSDNSSLLISGHLDFVDSLVRSTQAAKYCESSFGRQGEQPGHASRG